jgi:hypothetical protein
MFPQFRERIGSALDLVVEFSTLGEYRLAADGVLCRASALAPAPEREPQMGGAGAPNATRAAVRRIVAGGAAGSVPAATPAARRLSEGQATGAACRGERRRSTAEALPGAAARPRPATTARPVRPRTPSAPEQLCLAV